MEGKKKGMHMHHLGLGKLLLFLLVLQACQSVHHTEDENMTQEGEKPSSKLFVDYHRKFIDEKRCDQIIDNEFIIMCYDTQKKAVKAVSYILMGDLVNELNIKKRPSFYVEKSVDRAHRSSNSDYRKSGYDKGHMAPDAAFDWSQESLHAVYTLANIIPQAPKVNRHMWVKLERYVRDKAVELGSLKVVNVVSYEEDNRSIGKHHIAVSTGYYKILYNEDEAYEECFYYENNLTASSKGDTPLKHKVSCQEVGYEAL